MFISVDLPAPFSPSSACTSPSRRSKSTWSLARTPGNRFVMPLSSSAAGASSIAGDSKQSSETTRAGLFGPPSRTASGAGLAARYDRRRLDRAGDDLLLQRVDLRDVRRGDLRADLPERDA